MEIIKFLIDFILHMDVHLNEIITNYGAWTYGILFFVIFMETGFVVTPFLPGDSLLFAAGTFAALGSLNPYYLFGLLTVAAILGDTINYSIGAFIGERAFSGNIKFLKQELLSKQEIVLILVGGLFVLEALSVIVQVGYFKASGGRRVFRMAPLHHHFELSGWAEPKIIVRFWILAIMFALMGLGTLKLR